MFAPPDFQLKKFKRSFIRRAPTKVTELSETTPICGRFFYAGEAASTYNFQVSPLAKLQAFTFGRLGVVSPTIFVIVLCLGFALGLGFCSGVEVQKFCGKLSWIGHCGLRLGFRIKAYTCCIAIQSAICLGHLMVHLWKYPKP